MDNYLSLDDVVKHLEEIKNNPRQRWYLMLPRQQGRSRIAKLMEMKIRPTEEE